LDGAFLKTLYTIHGPDAEHLEEVMAEMRVLGRPAVRVVDYAGGWMALEGCHRLMAAYRLGVAPVFVVLQRDDRVMLRDFGFTRGWGGDRDGNREYTAREVAKRCYKVARRDGTGGCYRVGDGGLLELVYAGHPQS
jgi:hypothetical protein